MMINKRLISMMGDSKRYIAWNVVLQFLALLANIVMIFAVSLFLTGLVRREPDLPTALLYILGALIVRFFCTRGAASASYNASCTVKKTLRAAIYEKLLRLGGSYTQAVPTAEVLQLAGEGVEQLETYFGAYLPQFFYAMIAPVTLFIALAPVSLHAAVILMICVPLIPVSIVAVQKFAKKLLGKYWGRYAALGDSFLENLQGLTTLKIYQADGARHAAMNREAEHFRKVTMKVLTMQLNSIIVMDVIAYGGAALGIIVAAHEFNANRVTLPGALCIILLSADFFLPMRALGSYFHVAMNGMAASDKIFKLLDLPEGSARTAQLGADCAIACRDLHFGYTAEKETLHGLNLDFPQGSFTALVGESGCGKSTTLRVVAGFIDPQGGTFTLDGEDMTRVPVHKRQFGLVFQSYALFPHLSVYDNVAFGLRTRKMDKDVIDKKVREILEVCGLTELADRFPKQMSGGQRQRVALARALVIEPKLLLLDEPLSNLDAKLRLSMRVEIKRLQKRLGITTLFVTHDQEECFSISDKVAVMNGGVIEQFDTPENIYRRPATEFVARFIGFENFLELAKKRDGVYTAPDGSEFLTSVDLDCEKFAGTIRPDDICLADDVQTENVLSGKIGVRTFLGKSYQYEVETSAGVLKVNMGTDHVYKEGEEIRLYLPKDKLILVRR